nr:MAG TPA: hypothetical protein [Caudoviricetes sp.]
MDKLDKLYLDNTLRKVKLENSMRNLRQVSEKAIKKYKYDEAELDANIAKSLFETEDTTKFLLLVSNSKHNEEESRKKLDLIHEKLKMLCIYPLKQNT